MADGGGHRSRRDDGPDRAGASFDALASPVATPGSSTLPGVHVLLDALLDPDAETAGRALGRIVAQDANRFVDDLLPGAARRLGEMWLEDRASFAEVSIASARLQSALREIDPAPCAFDAPLVAVVVPQGETHTLGATVAAWRLRRAGASVMLLLDRTVKELEVGVGGGDLTAVCLSSSAGGDGRPLAPLVEILRTASGAPVLLGGAILDGADPDALCRASGADRVSWLPEDALRVERRRPA